MTAAQFDAIPDELTAADRWITWRRMTRDGRETKVPFCAAAPTRQASSTDPATWTSFGAACAAVVQHDFAGPGFVLGDGFSGIDLDGCRNPETGSIHPAAFKTIAFLDSYTEVSPSGCGVKVYLRGTLPPGRRETGKVPWAGYVPGAKEEVAVWDGGRYFAVTGQHLTFTPRDVRERTDALRTLHGRLFPAAPAPNGTRHEDARPVDLDDVALVERAMAAKNGDRFKALWFGDIGAYSSHSEADLALCNLLAFWTGADADRIDALFRQSGLMRDKWERSGYGTRTVATALASCAETYTPHANGRDEYDPSRRPDASSYADEPLPDDDGSSVVNDQQADRVELLFDPAEFRFDRFLDHEPPPRRWLIEEFLPAPVVGLLAGTGGLGKDFLIYQLGMSIATGLPFLDMPVEEVGGVLYLAAEDDEDELHRRGRVVFDHYAAMGRIIDRHAVAERLVVKSRVADNNLLTAGREGEVSRTRLVDRLIAQARTIPDLKLIALSPVSRFRGGRANGEEDTTRFVEALELVRSETGATVLATVHVNKSSISGNNDEGDQSIVRGSTALPDGARWTATMQRLRKDAAKSYGVDPELSRQYVKLELPKANYVRPFPGLWLKRELGGVMVPTSLRTQKEAAEARTDARVDREYEDVLGRVVALLQREGPMTGNHIETRYAGRNGVLAAGRHTVRGVLDRALEKGELIRRGEVGQGGGRVLEVAP
jgi:putative DNA primase/helicase